MKKLLLLLFLSLGLTSIANAGEHLYECIAERLHEQKNSSEIELSPDIWQMIYDAQKFTVSKETGLISGYFDNIELSDSRISIRGSSESLFKATYDNFDAGRWLILEIQTNLKGDTFKIIFLGGFLSGVCS